MSPPKGQSPKVKEPSDIDPREFLLDVKRSGAVTSPLQLTVRYFACNDEEGWCKPVTQQYAIYLESDRDAGRAMGRGMSGRGGLAGGGGTTRRGGFGGRRSRGGFSGTDFAARIMSNDKNGDGKVTKDEMPERMQSFFDRLDANGDGAIDQQEMENAAGMMGRRNRSPREAPRE